MTKDQLKKFREALLVERNKFASEIRSIAREASKDLRETSGDLSTHPIHMADISSDTYERELSMSLASTEQEVLYQIDDALTRVDDGTFGICQQCDKPISMSRLKAVPYGPLCIACQRTQEQKKK
jgi:RNA polymerase-binding protein DksA